ncbi:MAG TPA: STAS domain-containing protein [Spirochaetota bacterium]|nr:STAS domain-containing protein [Spirochaetota bacterium]HQO38967.1 STAS domain-containing protein [Spirochaetota bacterium]
MKVTSEQKENFIVINIKGTLSIENISPFETLVNKHVEKKDNILIDLSELTFIDSSSLGIIVVYFTKSEKNNRNFALLNINPDIMQMFKITGLDKRIRIFSSIDEATSALGTA